MNMSCISVPRNINVYPHKRLELVGYADASNIAHGCCLYLRVVRDDNTVNVNLLCSKSRINPKDKTLTIPRLELNSALLLAKLARKVHDTLAVKYNYIPIYLYLDSKIVLSWLKIESVKLTAYVANRIEKIKQLSKDVHWDYVSTNENPADCLSRGLKPDQLIENSLWFHGPQYLQNSEYVHDNSQINTDVSDTSELNSIPSTCNSLIKCKENNLFYSFRYSNLSTMARIMAYGFYSLIMYLH